MPELTPLNALLKDTKRNEQRVSFVVHAYRAARAYEDSGDVTHLTRWAQGVVTTAAVHADRNFRREQRRARRQAFLWRWHLRRPKGTSAAELQAFLDDLRRRNS